MIPSTIWRWSSYAWSASSAGWFCLYVVSQHLPALMVCLGCACVAGMCILFAEAD